MIFQGIPGTPKGTCKNTQKWWKKLKIKEISENTAIQGGGYPWKQRSIDLP